LLANKIGLGGVSGRNLMHLHAAAEKKVTIVGHSQHYGRHAADYRARIAVIRDPPAVPEKTKKNISCNQ